MPLPTMAVAAMAIAGLSGWLPSSGLVRFCNPNHLELSVVPGTRLAIPAVPTNLYGADWETAAGGSTERTQTAALALLQRPATRMQKLFVEDQEELPLNEPLTPESLFERNALFVNSTAKVATWHSLVRAHWHRWSPPPNLRREGIWEFWESAVLFDWGVFGVALLIAVLLRRFVLPKLEYYGTGLLLWLTLGAGYNVVIWLRLGQEDGINWFAGYLLELIFLVENLFIFKLVVQALGLPRDATPKVLDIVAWGQILFEMVFFMGLAAILRTWQFLPYMLGIWLIYCGYSTAVEQPHGEVDIMDSSLVVAFRACLGDRLAAPPPKANPTTLQQQERGDEKEDGGFLVKGSAGKWAISLSGLAVCVLLMADFLLEIDVVLTKIEEFKNPYIAFSSSACATFTIPESFFLSQGMMESFPLLKYGISCVLIIFGTQMLLHSFFVIPPLTACCIVVGVLAGCVLLSIVQTALRSGPGAREQSSLGSLGGFPNSGGSFPNMRDGSSSSAAFARGRVSSS